MASINQNFDLCRITGRYLLVTEKQRSIYGFNNIITINLDNDASYSDTQKLKLLYIYIDNLVTNPDYDIVNIVEINQLLLELMFNYNNINIIVNKVQILLRQYFETSLLHSENSKEMYYISYFLKNNLIFANNISLL